MTGQYEHNLDAKGRLILPAPIRREMDELCHVTISNFKYIDVYSDKEWKRLQEKVNEMTRKEKDIMRVFFANTQDCEVDSQGRILIPAKLRERVGITKSVTIIGFSDHAEIWDRDAYAAYEEEMFTPEKIAAIWENLPI